MSAIPPFIDCGPVGFQVQYSILAGMSQLQLQTMLAQAQEAYQSLMLGQKAVTVSIAQGDGSRTVSFNQADKGSLVNWIRELQAALGMNRLGRRPMRFNFVR